MGRDNHTPHFSQSSSHPHIFLRIHPRMFAFDKTVEMSNHTEKSSEILASLGNSFAPLKVFLYTVEFRRCENVSEHFASDDWWRTWNSVAGSMFRSYGDDKTVDKLF